MKRLVPHNEKERLQVLRQHNILDTPPESRFDAIVFRAANQFKVPIALFTLIDENRAWFKSRIGLDIQETDREIAFCGHVIAVNAPLVVEDVSANDVFADNPLVVGHPGISFYAGVPVRAPTGETLGALCIVDTTARCFPWSDFLLLGKLGSQIEIQLAARQAAAYRYSDQTMH